MRIVFLPARVSPVRSILYHFRGLFRSTYPSHSRHSGVLEGVNWRGPPSPIRSLWSTPMCSFSNWVGPVGGPTRRGQPPSGVSLGSVYRAPPPQNTSLQLASSAFPAASFLCCILPPPNTWAPSFLASAACPASSTLLTAVQTCSAAGCPSSCSPQP